MELSNGFHSKRGPKTSPDGHRTSNGRTDKHTSIFWRLLHNKPFGQKKVWKHIFGARRNFLLKNVEIKFIYFQNFRGSIKKTFFQYFSEENFSELRKYFFILFELTVSTFAENAKSGILSPNSFGARRSITSKLCRKIPLFLSNVHGPLQASSKLELAHAEIQWAVYRVFDF